MNKHSVVANSAEEAADLTVKLLLAGDETTTIVMAPGTHNYLDMDAKCAIPVMRLHKRNVSRALAEWQWPRRKL